jgi:glycosyltransferase involved in cell wall biosynthesis
MRRVRVLFLNDTARNGGPGRSLYHILRFLDPEVVVRAVMLPRPGIISELLTGSATGARVVDELHFARHLVENPVEPWGRAMTRLDFEAPVGLRGVRFIANVARGALSAFELSSTIRQGRYDVLYCNGTNADFVGGAVARMTKIPTIWHVRYTAVPSSVKPVHDWLARSPAVKRILCVSGASAALFPRLREKVKVVHNALDTLEFDPPRIRPRLRAELGLSEGTIVFGSHGRILRRKGYVEMVSAARLVLDRMTPEERGKTAFAVLGDTPEDFRPDHLAECRALVGSLGLAGHVHFLGFRSDIKPFVVDFDVAVVPSVYEDPLPRAVLESMALGKPVVAFDVGGVSEMLRDGVTGVLVPGRPPNVEELAAAMLRYARDPNLRQSHGSAARDRVVREFDGRVQAKTIEEEIVRASPWGRVA